MAHALAVYYNDKDNYYMGNLKDNFPKLYKKMLKEVNYVHESLDELIDGLKH